MGGAVLTGDTWGAWTHTSGQIVSEWSSFGVGRGPALGMPSVFVIHTLNCRRHVVWLQREPQRAWAGLWARLSAVSFVSVGACLPVPLTEDLGKGPAVGGAQQSCTRRLLGKGLWTLGFELGVTGVANTFIIFFFF